MSASESNATSPTSDQSEYIYNGDELGFASTTECHYVEYLQYPDSTDVQVAEGSLDDSTLPTWLQKDLDLSSASTGGRQNLTRGLRLLCLTTEERLEAIVRRKLPLTENCYSMVMQRFGLPDQVWIQLLTAYTEIIEFSNNTPSGRNTTGISMIIGGNFQKFVQLVVSDDCATSITYGLMITWKYDPTDPGYPPFLPQQIGIASSLCAQEPLLLLLCAAEYMRMLHQLKCNDLQHRLILLEQTLGQHEVKFWHSGNPLEVDLLVTTKALNGIGSEIPLRIAILASILLVVERVESFHSQRKTSEESREASLMFQQLVQDIVHKCRALLLQYECYEKKVNLLIQVVYQFMIVKGSRVNIALAESSAAIAKASKEDSAIMRMIAVESKKDSSAMKTIAILGMFFLPGTFIAAIFAMPVLNWDDNGGPIITHGFRYYWILTLPLTFAVLVLWALATLLPWRKWFPKLMGKEKAEEELEKVATSQSQVSFSEDEEEGSRRRSGESC